MVPAVTSHADVCGVLIISSSSSSFVFIWDKDWHVLTSGRGGGGKGVTPLLLICKLVCGSIRIVSAGGNQMTPVVAVFGSVSYFSLHRCYGASRNDPWDVLQNKSFCPPTLRFPSDGTYRATLTIRSSLSRRSELPRPAPSRFLPVLIKM